jgi:hypothetical protein
MAFLKVDLAPESLFPSILKHWAITSPFETHRDKPVAVGSGAKGRGSIRTVRKWEHGHACPTEDNWQVLAHILRLDAAIPKKLKPSVRVMCLVLHSQKMHKTLILPLFFARSLPMCLD